MSTEIGQRIMAAREASGLSIEAVAEYLDMDAADVSGIEAGTRRIDLDTLIQLVDLFGRSPEFLLSGRSDSDDRIIVLHPRSLSPRGRAKGVRWTMPIDDVETVRALVRLMELFEAEADRLRVEYKKTYDPYVEGMADAFDLAMQQVEEVLDAFGGRKIVPKEV